MSLRCDNCKDGKRQCSECQKLSKKKSDQKYRQTEEARARERLRYQTEEYKEAKRERDKNRHQTEEYREAQRVRRQAENYKVYLQSESAKQSRKKYDKKRSQTEEYKRWRREYDLKKRARHAEKEKAHAYVNAKVRTGKMPYASSLPCGDCGQPAVEYHHESYERDKWLDVISLCKQCHVNRHPKVTPTHPRQRQQL